MVYKSKAVIEEEKRAAKLREYLRNEYEEGEKMYLRENPDTAMLDIWRHEAIWKDERDGLHQYCEKIGRGDNLIEYSRRKYGRWAVRGQPIAGQRQWRKVRATLFGDSCFDLDIVSAHQSIFYYLCKKVGIHSQVPTLVDFINHKSVKYLPRITYGGNKCLKGTAEYDALKTLLNAVMYGGNPCNIAKEQGWKMEAWNYDAIKPMLSQIKTATPMLVNHPDNADIVKWAKERHRRILELEGKEFEECPNHKIMALICQDYERQFVDKMKNKLEENGVKVAIHIHDGMAVTQESVSRDDLLDLAKYDGEDAELNKYIKWTIKEWGDKLDMTQLNNQNRFNQEVWKRLRGGPKRPDFDMKRDYFEKFNCKIRYDTNYLTIWGGTIMSKPKKKFKDAWEDLRCWVYDADKGCCVEESFIDRWLKYEDLRCYDAADFYPKPMPPPNDYCYNLWNGFAIDSYELDKDAITDTIHNHFKDVIANGDAALYEYILNWIAWKFQFPGRKVGVCLIAHGEEGTGKSMIFEKLFGTIMGDEKLYITSKGDKIFGKFVDMKGVNVCIFNEAGAGTFHLNMDEFKDLVTRTKAKRELKGQDIETFNSFEDYILTSNNQNPIRNQAGARRWLMFEVSGKRKGDVAYFKKLSNDLENVSIMRKFYQECLDRDLGSWHPEECRPLSNYHLEVALANMPHHERFFMWLPIYNEWATAALSNRWPRLWDKHGVAEPITSNYKNAQLEGYDTPIKVSGLYQVYLKYCDEEGIVEAKRHKPQSLGLKLRDHRCESKEEFDNPSSNFKKWFRKEHKSQYEAYYFDPKKLALWKDDKMSYYERPSA